MQFKITGNNSAHDFEIGEIVWAERPTDLVLAADCWADFQQVLLVGEKGEAWWVGITEFEVVS